jgi:hypothetical protein
MTYAPLDYSASSEAVTVTNNTHDWEILITTTAGYEALIPARATGTFAFKRVWWWRRLARRIKRWL